MSFMVIYLVMGPLSTWYVKSLYFFSSFFYKYFRRRRKGEMSFFLVTFGGVFFML